MEHELGRCVITVSSAAKTQAGAALCQYAQITSRSELIMAVLTHDFNVFCSCCLLIFSSSPVLLGTTKCVFCWWVWSMNAFQGGLLSSVAAWPITQTARLHDRNIG